MQGVDLEITEHSIKLNGVEVALPSDAVIAISEISNKNPVTVTVTMFVRKLTINSNG
jgi:hypothetical protein